MGKEEFESKIQDALKLLSWTQDTPEGQAWDRAVKEKERELYAEAKKAQEEELSANPNPSIHLTKVSGRVKSCRTYGTNGQKITDFYPFLNPDKVGRIPGGEHTIIELEDGLSFDFFGRVSISGAGKRLFVLFKTSPQITATIFPAEPRKLNYIARQNTRYGGNMGSNCGASAIDRRIPIVYHPRDIGKVEKALMIESGTNLWTPFPEDFSLDSAESYRTARFVQGSYSFSGHRRSRVPPEFTRQAEELIPCPK